MKTLKVTLKQHTPLIHFQHDQHGATLRASEVKPKLDKYIIRHEFKDEFDECKSYLVGYDGDNPNGLREKFRQGYRALNYKMKISTSSDDLQYLLMNEPRPFRPVDAKKGKKGKKLPPEKYNGEAEMEYLTKIRESDQREILDLDSYPLYFGNMNADFEDSSEYKKMSITKQPIMCRFLFMQEDLFEHVNKEELLNAFFMYNNWGSRQSKGFGSFYIDESDPLYIAPSGVSCFEVKGEEIEEGEEPLTDDDVYYRIFSIIELLYKTFRGGINLINNQGNTDFYFKSLAFMYCKNRLNAIWDKKKVKEAFYSNISERRDSLTQKMSNHKYDNEILMFDSRQSYDIRDVFGFSTNEQWQSFKDSIEKKVAVKNATGEFDYPKVGDKPEIERMQSPILFKPIFSKDICVVYIIFQEDKVCLDLFKESGKICFYSKKEKDYDGFKKRFKIDIPSGFSCNDYFDYIFKELNFDISTHVDPMFHDHNYYDILKEVYEQLKNNMKL